MQIGIIGLGKMGSNFALHLLEKGYDVVGFDVNPNQQSHVSTLSIKTATSYSDLCLQLQSPRIILLSVPHTAVEEVLFGQYGLSKSLVKADIVIDSANAIYTNSQKNYEKLSSLGINYLDAGVSGGPEGARKGACFMIGGDKEAFDSAETAIKDLSAENGYAYLGQSGAGHYVKMVHNAIEYGMMQSLAEGFTLLKKSPFNLDLSTTAAIFSHGSVIRSALVQWLSEVYKTYGQDLEGVSGAVSQTGEGAWTSLEAKKLGVNIPILDASVQFRTDSEKNPSYTGKILTALRNRFGGHSIKENK